MSTSVPSRMLWIGCGSISDIGRTSPYRGYKPLEAMFRRPPQLYDTRRVMQAAGVSLYCAFHLPGRRVRRMSAELGVCVTHRYSPLMHPTTMTPSLQLGSSWQQAQRCTRSTGSSSRWTASPPPSSSPRSQASSGTRSPLLSARCAGLRLFGNYASFARWIQEL